MDEPERSLHLLAASNIIVGRTEFLVLPLPAPWRITRAVVTPEVRTTIRAGERMWVASGETRHVIFDRARNVGLALTVRATYGIPRLPRRARQLLDEGQAILSGHPARYRIILRGRGFLVRGDERALYVAFSCPETWRGLMIELSGACTLGELQTFLRALSDLECH